MLFLPFFGSRKIIGNENLQNCKNKYKEEKLCKIIYLYEKIVWKKIIN